MLIDEPEPKFASREWWRGLSPPERAAWVGGFFVLLAAVIGGLVALALNTRPRPEVDQSKSTSTEATETSAAAAVDRPSATQTSLATPSLTMALTATNTGTPTPPSTETPTPEPTVTLTDEDTVVQMVRQYYEFIQAGMGRAAYSLLHTELQSSPGFFPYEQWETTVANVEYEFIGVFPRYVEVQGNQARVDFVVKWEQSEKLPETRNHTFCFTYRIEDESWHIRHINFVFSDCFGLMNPTPATTP